MHNMDRCSDKWRSSIISCSITTLSSYRKTYEKYKSLFTVKPAVDKVEFIESVFVQPSYRQAAHVDCEAQADVCK